jgi:serine/threonine protein kinase
VVLGSGTYGEVKSYLSHPALAVKTFNKRFTVEDDRVVKELDFFAYARAHAIPWVPIYVGRVIEPSGRIHLLMERCGQSLLSFLSAPDQDPKEKAEICFQMIGIVYALGKHFGMCHLDLKPGNFLWDRPRRKLFLIDWGFCTIPGLRQGSLEGEDYRNPCLTKVVQTRDYRAPEIFLAGSRWRRAPAQDLWSLGICLYEIWKGKLVECSESPRSPAVMRTILSRFGPLEIDDDDHPLIGWKAFWCHDSGASNGSDEESEDGGPCGDEVFPSFLGWVKCSLLTTNPDHRLTLDELGGHPLLIEHLKDFTPGVPPDPAWERPEPMTYLNQEDGRQLPVGPSMWRTLVEWLWELTECLTLDLTTFFLGSLALRLVLASSHRLITRQTVQGFGAMCLFQVSIWCPGGDGCALLLNDLAYCCDHLYKREDLINFYLVISDFLPPLPDLWLHSPWNYLTKMTGFDGVRPKAVKAMVEDVLASPAHFEVEPKDAALQIYTSLGNFRISEDTAKLEFKETFGRIP